MERREIVHNAYAVVGQLSKGYDGMMKNESLLGRLANRFFWQLRGPRYESFVRQAFQGLPEDFSGTLLEVPVGADRLPRLLGTDARAGDGVACGARPASGGVCAR